MIYEIIISVLPIHPTYRDAWFDSLTTEWVFANFVCTTFQFFIKHQSIPLSILYVRIVQSPFLMKNCPEWNVIVIQSAKQIGYLVDLKFYSVPSSRSNRLDFKSSSFQGFEIVSDLQNYKNLHSKRNCPFFSDLKNNSRFLETESNSSEKNVHYEINLMKSIPLKVYLISRLNANDNS